MRKTELLLVLGILLAGLSLAGCGGGGGAPPDLASWVAPATFGGRIVFQSDRRGRADVYIMAPDGSGQQNLTVTPSGARDMYPALSWDGQHIAFTSDRKGGLDIYVMDVTGFNMKRLTFGGYNTKAAWSPDNAKIAYMRRPTAHDRYHIWVMNADGSGQRRLTNGNYWDNFPTWLPDGSGIVFSSDRKDDAYQLYRVTLADRIKDTQVTRLTFGGSRDTEPDCAPDASRIVFSSDRNVAGIFTIRLEGGDRQPVPNIRRTGYKRSMHPCWGPGGTSLAFSELGDTTYQIYKINLDGTGKTRLTFVNRGVDRYPTWSRGL